MYQDDLLNSLITPEQWRRDDIEKVKKEAYDAGYLAGISQNEKIIRKHFIENFKKATSIGESIYKRLSEIGFQCSEMYLKVFEVSSFKILFIVDLESYLSDKRVQAYSIVRELRAQIEDNDLFQIDASFMPKSGEVNYQSISSEGYIFKYEPQSR